MAMLRWARQTGKKIITVGSENWVTVRAAEKYSAQQTAAKDAEIERLIRKLESAGNAAKRERDRAETAERDRDSLREALTELVYQVDKRGNANMLLAYGKATALLAALKAGKDGHDFQQD